LATSLLKFLDRHGRLYVVGKNWPQRLWARIRGQQFELAPLQRSFKATSFALEQALARAEALDKEFAARVETEPYRAPSGGHGTSAGRHVVGHDPPASAGPGQQPGTAARSESLLRIDAITPVGPGSPPSLNVAQFMEGLMRDAAVTSAPC
jgi:hypothetical protein